MGLNRRSTSLEIRFLFKIIDTDKKASILKWIKNNFSALRSFCGTILRKSQITANNEEINYSQKNRYEVELVYWKQPELI